MTEASHAVFLSYASQDAEAAQRIAGALRAGGIEVFFDQSELCGGDAWDQKIRHEIHDCALFIPIISQHTQERLEGYFRREWKLAIDRTHDMAQQKLYEFVKLLQAAGVEVKFAMHPVAGRMPGHMDVLLAEAGVPYDLIEELEEVNDEFASADVALVIGANDVVNPAARTNKASPIYGMPIPNVDRAHQIYVVKRGQGKGYAGIENELFYRDNCNLIYGDAQAVLGSMIQTLKDLVPAGVDTLAA